MTQADRPNDRLAEGALLLATLVWGCSFTLAKRGGAEINDALALGSGAAFGPIALLGARFLLAAMLWTLLFPAARRGWTRGACAVSAALGLPLAVGVVAQHLGLDRTSEAESAFLTSLTVIFVPLLMWLWRGRPPSRRVWGAIALAVAGVFLLTGATPTGFGAGSLLGLGCALVFAFQLILVNLLMPRDSAWRVTGGMFAVVGGVCLGVAALLPGRDALGEAAFWRDTMAGGAVGWRLAVLVLVPTIVSFGLMNQYQPRVDPTRATLIYLLEPLSAGAFAWAISGASVTGGMVVGGLLILVANALVELRARPGGRDSAEAPIGRGPETATVRPPPIAPLEDRVMP